MRLCLQKHCIQEYVTLAFYGQFCYDSKLFTQALKEIFSLVLQVSYLMFSFRNIIMWNDGTILLKGISKQCKQFTEQALCNGD